MDHHDLVRYLEQTKEDQLVKAIRDIGNIGGRVTEDHIQLASEHFLKYRKNLLSLGFVCVPVSDAQQIGTELVPAGEFRELFYRSRPRSLRIELIVKEDKALMIHNFLFER